MGYYDDDNQYDREGKIISAGMYCSIAVIVIAIIVGAFIPSREDKGGGLVPAKEKIGVTVDYAVTVKSIYTGNQTPIWIKGTQFFEGIPGKDLNVGINGLPVTGSLPSHVSINFKVDGEDAVLNVPVLKSPMLAVVAICKYNPDRLWFIANIERIGENHVSVVASPATFAEANEMSSLN